MQISFGHWTDELLKTEVFVKVVKDCQASQLLT